MVALAVRMAYAVRVAMRAVGGVDDGPAARAAGPGNSVLQLVGDIVDLLTDLAFRLAEALA